MEYSDKDKRKGINEKFPDVMECIAFLRQYRKELKSKGSISYIECDPEDYKISCETGKEIFKENLSKSEQSEQK